MLLTKKRGVEAKGLLSFLSWAFKLLTSNLLCQRAFSIWVLAAYLSILNSLEHQHCLGEKEHSVSWKRPRLRWLLLRPSIVCHVLGVSGWDWVVTLHAYMKLLTTQQEAGSLAGLEYELQRYNLAQGMQASARSCSCACSEHGSTWKPAQGEFWREGGACLWGSLVLTVVGGSLGRWKSFSA